MQYLFIENHIKRNAPNGIVLNIYVIKVLSVVWEIIGVDDEI